MTDLTHEISKRLNSRLYNSKSPYVDIVYPTNGCSFQQPSTIIVRWNSGYFNAFYFPNVKIELYRNGEFYSTITESTTNNGQYSWETLIEQPDNNAYQIKISVVNYSEVFGFSDYFSLVGYWSNVGWIVTTEKLDSNTFDGLDDGWIVTTEKLDSNTFDGLDDGWTISIIYVDDNDFEGLEDDSNIGVFADGS